MQEIYRVPVSDGDRGRAGLVVQIVALVTGLPVQAIESRERQSPAARRARWLSMYVTHVGYGWPLERVAHAFGFNRATVSGACRWVEDARDRTDLDGTIETMEGLLRTVCEMSPLELG